MAHAAHAHRGLRALARSPWLWSYLGLYAAVLAAMHWLEGFGLALPLFVLVVMGGGFSAAAWAVTRSVSPLPYSVRRPRLEAAFLGGYLALVVAFLTWGLGAVHASVAREPWETLAVTGTKLLVFVVVPAIVLYVGFGYGSSALAPLGGGWAQLRAALVLSAALLAFQMVVGRGLSDVRQAHLPRVSLALAAGGGLLWACLEAGLVEEFFFRALVQSRLSAWLRSETGAVVIMCLLFGLAHAPGFYLRSARTLEGLGPHPSLLLAVGYAVVVTSVVGFFFGVLWARTRNLWLLVLVHGAGDWLQGIVPFARMWSLR